MMSTLPLGLEKTVCSSFIGEAVKGKLLLPFSSVSLNESNDTHFIREVHALYPVHGFDYD